MEMIIVCFGFVAVLLFPAVIAACVFEGTSFGRNAWCAVERMLKRLGFPDADAVHYSKKPRK